MGDFLVTLERKRIKNMYLRIKRTGEVQISAPLKTSIKNIHDFIHIKRSWIEKHRQKCLLQLEKETAQDLITKEDFPFHYTKMQQCLAPLLSKWQSIMNVSVTKVDFKLMKSRWGSCHPIKKQITLNLRLIEKPLHCLEYVLVHELVHLFEASHNQRFYALMGHYLPEWKQIKEQLK